MKRSVVPLPHPIHFFLKPLFTGMFSVADTPHPLMKICMWGVCVCMCILLLIIVVVRLNNTMYILWTLLEWLEHNKL